MSATDSGQWPLGRREVGQRVIAEIGAGIVMEQRADLLSMLKRANVHLASIALLDVAPEVKATAAAFVRESQALIRRIER